MIDQQTLALFAPFEREVGRYRRRIFSVQEFEAYVQRANGSEDAFVSTLPTTGDVDRAHFDLDGFRAIPDGKRLYLWGVMNGYPTIPILTGKKGIQIHILSKPFKDANAKAILTDIETYILREALGIKSWDEETAVDWHLFGNTASLCRIPNTLRPPENDSYATFLPPNFPEMSDYEILKYSKAPHTFNYKFGRTKSLLDLPFTAETEPIKESQIVDPISQPKIGKPMVPDDAIKFLSNLLSTRRLTQITQQNPSHSNRIVTTLELLDCGLTVDEIVAVYSRLGWHDFNEKITHGYVVDLAARYYRGEYRLRRPE